MSDAACVVLREDLHGVERWSMPVVKPPAPRPRPGARPSVAEIEAIGEEARREGHAQGLAEGRQAARAELEGQVRNLCALCDTLARPLARVDAALERQLAELATLVARRILETELRLQPEHILEVVRRAITALPAATARIEIRVRPEAAALLRQGLAEAGDKAWHILEDDTLKPGDCRVDGADSSIDASVETRLMAVIDAALDEDTLAEHPTGSSP